MKQDETTKQIKQGSRVKLKEGVFATLTDRYDVALVGRLGDKVYTVARVEHGEVYIVHPELRCVPYNKEIFDLVE